MRRNFWFWIVILCASLLMGSSTAWARSLKIGYFDLQAVLSKSIWGKRAKAQFEKKKKQLQAELQQKAEAFNKSKQEYEKQKLMLDEAAKKKKLLALRQQQVEGEKFMMATNAKLSKLSQQLTAPIIDKVINIVQKIGKKEKFDYIFEVQKGGLVYATSKTDLTDRVIKELNKVTPNK